jgi:hypothetical protein
MQAYEAQRATQAAMSSASSLGLTAHDAAVLHNSNKLTLRLQPCDVLARVAPAAHQCAQLEVDIAQQLSEAGSPVAALEAPEVFVRDDYVVTLWTYYEQATTRAIRPGRNCVAGMTLEGRDGRRLRFGTGPTAIPSGGR